MSRRCKDGGGRNTRLMGSPIVAIELPSYVHETERNDHNAITTSTAVISTKAVEDHVKQILLQAQGCPVTGILNDASMVFSDYAFAFCFGH